MSEDQQKQDKKIEPEADTETTVKQPVTSGSSIVFKSVLLGACLLSIAAATGSYLLWMQLEKTRAHFSTQIDQRITDQIDVVTEAQQKQFTRFDEAVNNNRDATRQILQLVQTMQKQLQQHSRRDLKLIQAEAVLRLAKNQFEVLHDQVTTITALKLASDLLKDYGQPQIEVIRNLVLTELQSVKNIVIPDGAAELIRLDVLISKSDLLPMAISTPEKSHESEEQPNKEEADKSLGELFKGMLKKLQPLVTVRRKEGATFAMLSVEEERLVRLILKSRYEQIRQALLHKDTVALRDSIKSTRIWLERFYNTEKIEVKETLTQLDQINALVLDIEYPTLGYALQQLSKFREQGAESAAP